MVGLIAGGCTVVVVVGGWLVWRRSTQKPGAGTYQVIVALHVIWRRFDVFQFKVEVRRDAAQVRRRLGAELDELYRRERRP